MGPQLQKGPNIPGPFTHDKGTGHLSHLADQTLSCVITPGPFAFLTNDLSPRHACHQRPVPLSWRGSASDAPDTFLDASLT